MFYEYQPCPVQEVKKGWFVQSVCGKQHPWAVSVLRKYHWEKG